MLIFNFNHKVNKTKCQKYKFPIISMDLNLYYNNIEISNHSDIRDFKIKHPIKYNVW